MFVSIRSLSIYVQLDEGDTNPSDSTVPIMSTQEYSSFLTATRMFKNVPTDVLTVEQHLAAVRQVRSVGVRSMFVILQSSIVLIP